MRLATFFLFARRLVTAAERERLRECGWGRAGNRDPKPVHRATLSVLDVPAPTASRNADLSSFCFPYARILVGGRADFRRPHPGRPNPGPDFARRQQQNIVPQDGRGHRGSFSRKCAGFGPFVGLSIVKPEGAAKTGMGLQKAALFFKEHPPLFAVVSGMAGAFVPDPQSELFLRQKQPPVVPRRSGGFLQSPTSQPSRPSRESPDRRPGRMKK